MAPTATFFVEQAIFDDTFGRWAGREGSTAMVRRIAIALAAASLFGVASIPTGALAFGHGLGGHGGFGGGGFGHGGFVGHGFAPGFAARSFAAPALVGAPHAFGGHGFVGPGFRPGFRNHRFARFGVPFGLGLGLGYGAYSSYGDPCYAWTPYGYTWVCGYDY
jgi:hypothetical protein